MRLPNICEVCDKEENNLRSFSYSFAFGDLISDICLTCHDLGKEYLVTEILKSRAKDREIKLPADLDQIKKLI